MGIRIEMVEVFKEENLRIMTGDVRRGRGRIKMNLGSY